MTVARPSTPRFSRKRRASESTGTELSPPPHGDASARIVPPPPPPRDDSLESPSVWGFRDTAFQLLPNRSVRLTGARYQLSGTELPDVIPWAEEQFEIRIDPDDIHPSRYPTAIPEARDDPAFVRELGRLLPADAIARDPETRLRHGHGHTQDEMYAIKYGAIARVPDLVVFPAAASDVEALVELARRYDVCLVPYGGGTNVSGALACRADDERLIVSVDLRRLSRILWIDPTNRMAAIEAGAVGRDIAEQLARYGFTMGHEPDSIEFSTLGGWIATNASGMKKNRYGNIEDLVLDLEVVTSAGTLSHVAIAPRESIGLDARRWMFGSEGTLGIITSAVVKIFPLPEVQRYDAFIFPDFDKGVAFMHDLTRNGAVPASVRLMDNLQFQLGQTLKPRAAGLGALKRRLERHYVTRLRGFAVDRMAACTLAYEGTRDEVAAQAAAVKGVARSHGGIRGGAANGERGYQLTYSIAYLRDFIMGQWILGESFETSVPWSQVLTLCENVKRRLRDEHRRRKLPGKPFVTCRVTQVYETGVCVYFYAAVAYKGVDRPSEIFAELERSARDEILLSGGSLSHHHGIGKLREQFLPRIVSPGTLAWREAVKRAVDPTDVFGVGNQRPAGGA